MKNISLGQQVVFFRNGEPFIGFLAGWPKEKQATIVCFDPHNRAMFWAEGDESTEPEDEKYIVYAAPIAALEGRIKQLEAQLDAQTSTAIAPIAFAADRMPVLGDTVLVKLQRKNSPDSERAARVVAVWGKDTINVMVELDGLNDLEATVGGQVVTNDEATRGLAWRTSLVRTLGAWRFAFDEIGVDDGGSYAAAEAASKPSSPTN